MGLLRNKKGVEGLPLKYVIIALVAVVVIGMALYVTDSLGTSVKGATDKIGDTLTERTTCELDNEDPIITFGEENIESGSGWIAIQGVVIEDECGIDVVVAYFNKGAASERLELLEVNGSWEGNKTGLESGTWNVTVWAKDRAPAENSASKKVEDIQVI